jgi:hypothetical protein
MRARAVQAAKPAAGMTGSDGQDVLFWKTWGNWAPSLSSRAAKQAEEQASAHRTEQSSREAGGGRLPPGHARKGTDQQAMLAVPSTDDSVSLSMCQVINGGARKDPCRPGKDAEGKEERAVGSREGVGPRCAGGRRRAKLGLAARRQHGRGEQLRADAGSPTLSTLAAAAEEQIPLEQSFERSGTPTEGELVGHP